MADPIPSELQEDMTAVANMLKELFHPMGFTLMVFDHGNAGRMNYMSSANRDDMITAMKEFIAYHEGRKHDGPGTAQ